MTAIHLFYGLAFFTLGLAALLESRRRSELLLRRQLPWLAAFGLVHSLVEWCELLLLNTTEAPAYGFLSIAHLTLLPLSALLLIRFGIGLISESNPMPRWLLLTPLFLIVLAGLLIAYILIIITTEDQLVTAGDIFSRWLLLFPGSLLAAAGFLRQSRGLPAAYSPRVRSMMRGAGFGFLFYAVFAGLIVPPASYGPASWLNYGVVRSATGLPVQVWRMFAGLGVTLFVVRTLDVFDFERKQQLEAATRRQREAEKVLRESETRFRNVFEFAPIGMDVMSPEGCSLGANRALQEMLGYSEDELHGMVFTDYTASDNAAETWRLAEDVRAGRRKAFQIEGRYRRKDGALVHGNMTVSGVRDAAGELTYFIAMVEDVTERNDAQEVLLRERERAQEAWLRLESESRRVAERWVNTLVEVGSLIARMESLDVVLLHIMKQAEQLVKTDTVSLGLLDKSAERLELRYHAVGGRAHPFKEGLVVDNQELIEILRSGHAYRFRSDVGIGRVSWYCPTVAREVRAAAVVPLHFDGQVVGGLWAARFQPQPFSPSQLFGLENLADQAVIALQHAAMASRMQSVASLEERSRIAREMHDGLGQVLGYLGVQMQTIEAYARQGQQEKIVLEIQKCRDNIRLAQADVRDNILSLRTTLAGEGDLVPALEEYVKEFSLQCDCHIDARLVNQSRDVPRLSPMAEVQLVRIVQEALINVRKHARADHVEIRLRSMAGGVQVTVQDDGVGFNKVAGQRSFGLQTMAERASSVGGNLEVHTEPGAGTVVRLWLPLLPE